MKYVGLKPEMIKAVINKLGGVEGVQRFLRGELEVKPVRVRRLAS